MESANSWSQIADINIEVRVAEQADAQEITRLLRNASFSHVHADWHYPVEWLGKRSFVIVPRSDTDENRKRFPSTLFSTQSVLQACLAVAADPEPAAWVRLAAVANKAYGRELMASMLAAMVDSLREENISQIAWLLVEDWPETWLPDLGFEQINEVITYSKLGTDFPNFTQPLNI